MDDTIKYFVGVDLHKTILQVCVLDGDGEILKEGRFRGGSLEEGLEIVAWLTQWKEGGRFCVEALGLNRWFVLACQDRGLDVVVVGRALCRGGGAGQTKQRERPQHGDAQIHLIRCRC